MNLIEDYVMTDRASYKVRDKSKSAAVARKKRKKARNHRRKFNNK